jgi:hypothetical protein
MATINVNAKGNWFLNTSIISTTYRLSSQFLFLNASSFLSEERTNVDIDTAVVGSKESMIRTTILTPNHETSSDAGIMVAIGNGDRGVRELAGSIKNAAGNR